MQRRGFLATITGALTFGAFERGVMAEAGVKSPLDLLGGSTTREVWLVRCLDTTAFVVEMDVDEDNDEAPEDVWRRHMIVVAVAPSETAARELERKLSCQCVRQRGLDAILVFGWLEAESVSLQSPQALEEGRERYAWEPAAVSRLPLWLDSLLDVAAFTERLFFLNQRLAGDPEHAAAQAVLRDGVARDEILGKDFATFTQPRIFDRLLTEAQIFDRYQVAERLADDDLYELVSQLRLQPVSVERISVCSDAIIRLSDSDRWTAGDKPEPATPRSAPLAAELSDLLTRRRGEYREVIEQELAREAQAAAEEDAGSETQV